MFSGKLYQTKKTTKPTWQKPFFLPPNSFRNTLLCSHCLHCLHCYVHCLHWWIPYTENEKRFSKHLWKTSKNFEVKFEWDIPQTNRWHYCWSTKQEEQQRERIAEFLASSDEDGIITDLRKLNGKKGTKFEEFWDEINNLFSEYEASVQERRHGSLLYLPFAISIQRVGRTYLETRDTCAIRWNGEITISSQKSSSLFCAVSYGKIRY